MSMLAERKRKQKWSLNPRGKYWAEDTNKFGQKMLEKMGWSTGKGLGANEDGITEHIKVAYKNDSKGMGFKETDDQWTEHESNFTQLLSSLSGASETPIINENGQVKLESLEQKSQKSRARVHYHKFTRGKDLSRYSEKDLANIFGKKSLSEKKISRVVEVTEEKDSEKSDSKFGVQTLNGGSMLDYFKKKLPNYNKYSVNSKDIQKNDSSESDCERPSFGFGFNTRNNNVKSSFVSYIQENSDQTVDSVGKNIDKIKKKKKPKDESCEIVSQEEGTGSDEGTPSKKKRKSEKESDCAFTPLKKKFKKFDDLNSLQDEEKITLTPAKKCKKKKSDKKAEEKAVDVEKGNGLSNPAFDPFFKEVILEKHSLEVINEDDENLDEETFETSESKKEKKVKNGSFPQMQEPSTNSFEEETEGKKSKKHKKTKKNKERGIENSCFNDSLQELDSVEDEPAIEVSKKKLKRKKIDNGISNPCFEDNLDSTENVIAETKKGKKRKHKDAEKLGEDVNLESNQNFHQDSRKHKRKKEKENSCVENPGFDPNDSVGSTQNTVYEVLRKKKKSKSGIDNPSLDLDKKLPGEKLAKIELEELEMPVVDDEVTLNIVATPTNKVDDGGRGVAKKKGVNQRTNVNGKLNPLMKRKNGFVGIENEAFDDVGNQIEENIDSLSKELDNYQAEVENDMNEAKIEIMVGEMGDQSGENEILPNGDTKLKFKYAHFGRVPPWMKKNDGSSSKTSYRHLIKGDIVLGFKNTNLHAIEGYSRKQIETS